MKQARGSSLEDARDNDHAQFRCQGTDSLRDGARDRLGKLELIVVFGLTKVATAKQFLQTDEIGPRGGCFCDRDGRSIQVLFHIGGTGKLDRCDFD